MTQKRIDDLQKTVSRDKGQGIDTTINESMLENLKGIMLALGSPEKGPGVKIGTAAEESGYGFAAMAARNTASERQGNVSTRLACTPAPSK